MSMLGMPITVLLGFYFRRRRSLAMSVMKCGVGAGAVAFPPIVTFLLNQYGLRGALLIMGGVCLNTLVGGSLLRPTSFYKKLKLRRNEEVSVIEDAAVRENGCQNGSSVIVIEEDVLPVSVHGPGGEKRTLLVHHTDGVTMLSRSTPELHLERMFRPRTFSVNDKYYSSTPQRHGRPFSPSKRF